MKIETSIVLILLFISTGVFSQESSEIKPNAIYGKEARVVSYLLNNNHFGKIKFNDSISSAVYSSFFETLDNSKLYFTKSDVNSFEKYRYSLDDLAQEENVNPAFEIYAVFQQRYRNRLKDVVDNMININFNYTIDEYYETNREKADWAKNSVELDEVWRKLIKSQALSLKIDGKNSDEIKTTLKNRYNRLLKSYDQFTSEDVFSIYMNCITEAFDPHTNYLSPKSSELFQQSMSLSFEGIGARLQTENDYVKVIEVIAGGPAEKSKLLRVNDLISGVGQGKDGEIVDVVGWRIDEVVKLIKGPKGTVVRLQIIPATTGIKGPPTILSLVREKINLEDQAAKKKIISYNQNGKNLKLGVITLPSFYMNFEEYRSGNPDYKSTTRDVKNLILELKKEKVEGIVMDLRNNGGGSLSEAINLTGLFIDKGPIVQVKSSSDKIEVGSDEDEQKIYDGPLVVLTNRFSASASEIFAGAIQDYKRGVIVGESTFGKGTVQTIIELDRYINNQSKVGDLKITFQKFYRVTGRSTQLVGVMPDINFPSTLLPQQFGESSSPNPLPWDSIRMTNFQKTLDVSDKLVLALAKDYQNRLNSDSTLMKYVSEVNHYKKINGETRISLLESKRRQEIADAKDRDSASLLEAHDLNKENLPIVDLADLNDEYLREGIIILSEMVTFKAG